MKASYSNWTPRTFMDEFFSPMKYAYGDMSGKGTKDDPFVIKRQTVITKTYHGYINDDGSYHEVLVPNNKETDNVNEE